MGLGSVSWLHRCTVSLPLVYVELLAAWFVVSCPLMWLDCLQVGGFVGHWFVFFPFFQVLPNLLARLLSVGTRCPNWSALYHGFLGIAQK